MNTPAPRSAALPANDVRVPGDTRQRILDVAQASVLDKGFSATSIEEIIVAVGITKSGFFYHFAGRLPGIRAVGAAQRKRPAF